VNHPEGHIKPRHGGFTNPGSENDRCPQEIKGSFYVITVMDAFSRAILSSDIFQSQDLACVLIVLYAAVEQFGAPRALITDIGGVFRAATLRRFVYRERVQPGLRCMTHTFPVISLCSQWLWLFLQAALELKNSSNTGARTCGATSWV
jgi:hypothetical protein